MKMTRTVGEYMQLVFRANIDSQLLILKSMLILNSGALVSILIALSRAGANDFSEVIVGSAYYFWGGLLAAIVSIIFYVPEMDDVEELSEIFNRYKWAIGISALSLICSCGLFLYGSWSIIADLDALFLESVSADG